MKQIKITIAIFTTVFFTSCVTSLHPLVTNNNVVEENRIAGLWKYEDMNLKVEPLLKSELYELLKSKNDSNGNPLRGEKDSLLLVKSYSLAYIKNGIHYYMLASFTRVNNALFIDLLPVDIFSPDSTEVISPGVKETHSFAKVIFQSNNQVQLNFLSPDFIEKQLRQERVAIKHEKIEMTGDFLITASSEDLRHFLTKYEKDDRLYTKENSVTLNKAK